MKYIYLAILSIIISSCKKTDSTDFKTTYENGIIKSKIENLKIGKDSILNQGIYYDSENKIDLKLSQYYQIKNNCIEYHSPFDSIETTLGKDRFIFFKTSKQLKSDFSNADSIKLEMTPIKTGNSVCFNKELPDYGFFEDTVFFSNDSIVNGEETTRIVTRKLYFNSKKEIFK